MHSCPALRVSILGILHICVYMHLTAPYSADIEFESPQLTVREGVNSELDVCILSVVSGDVHPLEPDIPLTFIFDDSSTAEGM